MKIFRNMALVASLAMCVPLVAQTAGQDMKNAGHDTANATKKTAHKVKRGTKKGVHKTAHATKKGANKVEGKTDTTNPK
ncbi:MAG TPA: hypothetical protein VFU50_12845 [Terriglobales bacterium]|nr:hypothetical protein [Terriglobales bacterium]